MFVQVTQLYLSLHYYRTHYVIQSIHYIYSISVRPPVEAPLYIPICCDCAQILVKLCSFVSPAEELAQKDDLQLLFSAITSWCPPHNLPWRRSAGEVLATISRHGLSVNVVKYIHGQCINSVYLQPSKVFLVNLQK